MNHRQLALAEIHSMVDAETNAWNNLGADALVALFHPDMVWVWPPDAHSHDPETWVMPMGRFNADRWKSDWNRLFSDFALAHNHRTTVRIEVSDNSTEPSPSSTSTPSGSTNTTNPNSTGKAAPARFTLRPKTAGSSSTKPASSNTLDSEADKPEKPKIPG